MSKDNVCCVFGHRTVKKTERLYLRLRGVAEGLILNEGVDTFLFGSKSEFNDICHAVVTEMKQKYPHVKRVYVRAEYPDINDSYEEYLLEDYEQTYYPEKIRGAGRSVYVERNCEMIDNSRWCIVYFNEDDLPPNRKSGTQRAFSYAVKKGRNIINVAK